MLGGKRRGQPLVATSAAGQQMGRLLYVTDREPRLRFLFDTGSEVSIIPPSKAKLKNRQDTFDHLATSNLPIVTYRYALADVEPRTTSHLPTGV